MKPDLLPFLLMVLWMSLLGMQCGASADEEFPVEIEEPDPGYPAETEEPDADYPAEMEEPEPDYPEPDATTAPPPRPAPRTEYSEDPPPMASNGSGHSEEVAAIIAQMPKFPLPYPNPSASARFSVGAFATWGAVDRYITNKLFSEGFRGSYFYVPGGFALVSQIEQIDAEGNSLNNGYRFSLDNAPALRDDFSFFDYLRALLRPNPGKYRCIVFVLSPEHFQYSSRKLSRAEAAEWLQSGYNRLPAALRRLPVTEDYELTILVYEFLKPEHDEEVAIMIPSNLDALSHIEKANLMFD